MEYFHYRNGKLFAEEVSLSTLAHTYGTPCYVYSRRAIEDQWRAFHEAFNGAPHLICYAVKANANLAVLSLLAHLGSGFDIVSGGELERVLLAGGLPRKIVFSGVGKSAAEIRRALEVGIRCFNVESLPELERINDIAGNLAKRAPISLRVNPNVDPKTHPYISTGLKENKFGISIDSAAEVYVKASVLPHLEVVGVDCHIGSQLTSLQPFIEAIERIVELVAQLNKQGIPIRHIDVGGGLGVRYRDETPPTPHAYVTAIRQALGENSPHEILLEPGRAIVANAGILLTRVEYLKHTGDKHFAIVDAAMNDLIRPALYSAWQEVLPVRPRHDAEEYRYDIVGPVCESGDFLGKNRPLALKSADLLAICSAGAYGFVMSSNYNSRPRAAEVMVEDRQTQLVRKRESLEDLWALEAILEQSL